MRYSQAKEVVDRIRSFVAEHPQVRGRVVWVGDFNAGPHTYGGKYPCGCVPFLTSPRDASGRLQIPPNAEITIPLPVVGDDAASVGEQWFVSSAVDALGAELPFTTFKYRDGALIEQTIDYILIQAGGALRCTSVLAPPPRELLLDGGLPSIGRWGSDHLALCAEIVFADAL